MIKDRRLPGAIVVQVLDVEDISRSRWEQLEAIEALERGEGTRGREIIRVPALPEGDDAAASAEPASKGGIHKVMLQDARGKCAYGIELKSVEGISISMSIGMKIVLKDAVVARSVVLLEPQTAVLVGGKIEELHKAWREGQKERLKAAIQAKERED